MHEAAVRAQIDSSNAGAVRPMAADTQPRVDTSACDNVGLRILSGMILGQRDGREKDDENQDPHAGGNW